MDELRCFICNRALPLASDQADPGEDELTVDTIGDIAENQYVCGKCIKEHGERE